ncbi:hypothetical protein [Nitrosococcus watsonii]|uniref:Uncharacterized protein n=1 Tax=Nitrosococcus watsoni (strain C-113) TaxID=105559 RepID=D8KBB5_NITWC|nr:hypothetical protein [Nitrosococcus watsonii]ADJ29562.1 conserved hypothetical protein [Nitrosococcus watsonii C-113]
MTTSDALRAYLKIVAGSGVPVYYRDAARALALEPPQTIRQLALMLEQLIEEDAAAGVPLIASLVIGRQRDGLPAPGYFAKARAVGVYHGATSGPQARAFHAEQLRRAVAFWSEPG